jgi:hypothetical protein
MTRVLAVPAGLDKPAVRPAPTPRSDGRAINPDIMARVMLLLVAGTLAAWRFYSCGRLNVPGALFLSSIRGPRTTWGVS